MGLQLTLLHEELDEGKRRVAESAEVSVSTVFANALRKLVADYVAD